MYLVSIPAPPSAAHLVDQRQRAAASTMILFGDVGILTWCQSSRCISVWVRPPVLKDPAIVRIPAAAHYNYYSVDF